MRRTLVLALAALTLLGATATGAYAQGAAPTPTFKITGFIDEVMSYARNVSNVDGDMRHIDTQWYGRTRGRFDIIGEYGKAKAVFGLETDMVYGQVGSNDSTIVNAGGSATTAVSTQFGTDGSFDLNTDTRAIIEVKWLYTEFEVPLIPVPTVMRLGAQPYGSAANYKLAVYANGDFPGVNVVATITPNVKLVWTWVAVEEALVGRSGGVGIPVSQLRGEDWAMIIAPEVTPFKGLDIKPMYSYFEANGITNGNARQGRGGISTTSGFQGSGGWVPGIHEDRHTIGADARVRLGGFSLNPTVLYQFGHRDVIVPSSLAGPSGKTTGSVARADLDAWLVDVRAGYQLGPLLLEAMGMFTTGNKASDTTLGTVKYFQPLSTDTSYLADWGGQLAALGVDYLNAMMEAGNPVAYPGTAIGFDKYGRIQFGARATYAFTPALSAYLGANGIFTHRAVDTDGTAVSGGGILPAFATGKQDGNSNYLGTELFTGTTWRFAPGLTWDNAFGYMLAGHALAVTATPSSTGQRDAKDAYILTSRLRFSF
jgi:hypothetical protein